MTRSAILIFIGLLMVGCARSTPAPVVYGQTSALDRAPAPVSTVRRVARPAVQPVTAAVPLPENKPQSLQARPAAAAPVTRVVRTRAVSSRPASDGNRAGTMAKVRAGDTVYSVAQRHNVSVRDLIDENRLSPPFRLIIGQRLIVPASGRHRVAARETVYSIARRYGVEMQSVVRSNGLVHPFHLKVGQVLWIPGSKPAPASSPAEQAPAPRTFASIARQIQATAPAPPAQGSPETAQRAAPTQVASLTPVAPPVAPSVESSAAKSASPDVADPAPKPTARLTPNPKPAEPDRMVPGGKKSQFIWPTRGRVISRFGVKRGGLHNDGINIAVAKGAPVRAAAGGVVAYAGNELRGFGNLVLIRHPGGWTTAYAHNDALLVKRGDKVRQGDLLARAGSSGSVKRTQLHFEIRRGTEAVDPLKFLAHGGGNRTG